MDGPQRASRCRQQIAEELSRLTRLAQGVQGRGPIIRASLYRYERRCGDPECRCGRGSLHEGRALSVSQGGRSRALSLAGLDVAEVERQVEAYREFRQARGRMVQAFAELLKAVDELGRLRTVPVERLRRGGVRAK